MVRMVPQGAKAKPSLLEPFNQRLQHSGRPGVLARPDPQVASRNVATAHIAQRLVQQRGVAGRLTGQFLSPKNSGRPTHMRNRKPLRWQSMCRDLAARRAEQGQRRFAGYGLQTIRWGDFRSIQPPTSQNSAPHAVPPRGEHETPVLRVASIGAPVGVVPGMGGKLMSLCSACATTEPNGLPGFRRLRALVGGKRSRAPAGV